MKREDYDYNLEAIRAAKPTPNWREAFEQVLAKGGKLNGSEDCGFCQIKGVGEHDQGDKCHGCVLDAGMKPYPCELFLKCFMDNSERRAICRHVLLTVKDFTDRDEIRARIAEMLDDPEKFFW